MLKNHLLSLLILSMILASNQGYAKGNAFTDTVESLLYMGLGGIKKIKDLENLGRNSQKIKNSEHNKNIPVQQNKNISSISKIHLMRKDAYNLSKNNNDIAALRIYEDALKINNGVWQTWHGYAHSLYKLKRYKDAEIAFNKAIKINPNEHSWLHLGLTFQAQGRKDRAIHAYKKALQISPNNLETRKRLAALSIKDNRVQVVQREKNTKTPAIKGRNYTIQAGAFSSNTNAVAMMNKVKSRDQDVYMVKDKKSNLYHVYLGKFKNMNEANKSMHKLKRTNRNNKFVVKEVKY